MTSICTTVSNLTRRDGEVSFAVAGPLGDQQVRFWGDIPQGPGLGVESALASALLPAMATSGELSLPRPLSPQLCRTLPDVQAVLASLALASPAADHPLSSVDVVAPPASADVESEPGPEVRRGVGAFFSGGVDSWSTLLSNSDITDLIYVHGFDIPLDQWDASATVERRLAKTADRLGMRLHLVRTNLRALLDQNVPWEIAHGIALAAVALLFAPICERVLIGAGMTYGELVDRGSHPLHDHLWSTEGCRIEHYGAHLRRSAKTEQVAKCQEALDTLRVCWRRVDLYNCGRCEKCLRTMVALEAVDALDRCPAFGVPLDLDAVASLRFYRSGSPDLVGREPRPRASAQRRRPRSHPGSVSHGQPAADRRPERRARGRRGASGQVGARAAGNPVVPLLATHRPVAPGGIRCPPGQPPRNRRLIASRSVDPRKRPIRVADRAARPCSYRSATLSERA